MPDRFSVAKRLKSFLFAFRGIGHAFVREHNLWIHSLAAITALIMGFTLGISRHEWLIIAMAITMVYSAELFNSAIESWVDLVSPETAKKAGNIKDMAAGAVLLSALGALATGLIIFLPKLC